MEKAAARVLAIAEELDDRFLRTVVHYVMALDLAQRGYLKDACAWASQSVELGRETGYPPASSWGFCIRACARSWAEDYEGAVMDAREAVRVGQSKYDRLMAKMTLGSSLVLAGNTAEGRRLLEEAKEERVGRSMIGFMYWPDTVYGLALLSSDDPVLGLEELEGSFRRFLDLGHFRAAGQVGLVIGEAYGRMAHGREHFPHSAARMNHQLSPCLPDAGARALESLKRALDLAQETEMDGVAAEALLGLAALANAEGRSDEARNYLSRAQDKARTLDRPTLERSVRNIDEALASGA
jgi:tetratricopeptide (TPR) repeat protein